MREKILTTVGLIIASVVTAWLMVLAVDAIDFEAQALDRRVAAHVARMAE